MVTVGIVYEFEIVQVQHAKGEGRPLLDQGTYEAKYVLTGYQTCQRIQHIIDPVLLKRPLEIRIA